MKDGKLVYWLYIHADLFTIRFHHTRLCCKDLWHCKCVNLMFQTSATWNWHTKIYDQFSWSHFCDGTFVYAACFICDQLFMQPVLFVTNCLCSLFYLWPIQLITFLWWYFCLCSLFYLLIWFIAGNSCLRNNILNIPAPELPEYNFIVKSAHQAILLKLTNLYLNHL